MSSLGKDVTVSIRSLWRARGFSAIAILTIGLAAGVAGSVFGVVDTLVLRSLPYPEPDRIVAARSGSQEREDFPLSVAEYLDYRLDSKRIEAAGAYQVQGVTVTRAGGDADVALAADVTPSLLPLLGLTPSIGRPLTEEEGRDGGPAVALISHEYWQASFAADPSVVERGTVVVNGVARRVVGVLAEGAALPGAAPSIYLPLQLPSTHVTTDRSGHGLVVLARLRDGVTFDEARAEAAQLEAEWQRRYDGEHTLTPAVHPFKLRPFRELVLGGVWSSIHLLVWAALVVTVLASANLSTLMLARSEARKSELGVRSALGAGFARLARLTFVESVTLAVAGGALGVGMSALVLRWVGAQEAGALRVGANSLGAASVDLRLAAVTVAVAALSGIVFGIVPAWAASRLDLTQVLASSVARSGSSRALRRTFNVLVFVQLALAAVLLNGTAMLVDGFRELTRVEPGFRTEGRMAFSIRLEPQSFDEARILAFYDEALRVARATPGVESAAAARALPMRRSLGTEGFVHEGQVWKPGEPASQVYFQATSTGYLEAMGIPLLAGRDFEEHDRTDTTPVALVNRSAAVAYFGSVEGAIGKRIHPLFMGGENAPLTTIVGVTGDVRHHGQSLEPQPELTLTFRQARGWMFETMRGGELVLHVSPGAEDGVMTAIRARLAEVAPGVPVYEVASMDDALRASVAQERFLAQLTGGFGAIAVAIAAVGVLGVVLFGVNAGRRELGVRMALGQAPSSLAWHVLARGLRLGVAAVVAGVALTLASGRVVAAAVQGAGRLDPPLLAMTTAGLLAVVVLACLMPAIKAMRLDPKEVLGVE